MAPYQRERQPQGQPKQDEIERLGGLCRLNGDGSQQPTDVEARRAQRRVQRVAFGHLMVPLSGWRQGRVATLKPLAE